jgi:hypothetical protein
MHHPLVQGLQQGFTDCWGLLIFFKEIHSAYFSMLKSEKVETSAAESLSKLRTQPSKFIFGNK